MKSLDVFLSEIFLSLESFLQKATTLNIFEALIFNYKIKVNSVEQCSPQFISFVVDLCNELQLILRDNVVSEIEKSSYEEKEATTFCELQPADPDFAEFTNTETSTIDAELINEQVQNKENWEANICDVENKQDDINSKQSEIEIQPSSPPKQEKQKTLYTCDYCNRKYRTNGKFSRHTCKLAPVTDVRDEESVDDPDSAAADHIPQTPCDSEAGTELPVYVCAFCLSTYCQREHFDQHTHTDTSQEVELMMDLEQLQSQRKFSCGVCCEVYRSLARISYHVARCRTGPYRCELCPHVVPTKQLLNRHKKKHHKGVESFFCSECGLGFKLRTSLQKHMVNRHESKQNFSCDCGEVFLKKIQLTNHRIEVHGVERKFLCQVCGHKFMTQDSLSCHLECHSNKRKFQCRFCLKLFTTKEKLTFHVRAHTGEKPFVCERASCRKSFVSKSKLAEHMQRHRGEKRHKCHLCGKQYANKPDLRTHLRKIHPSDETIIKTPTSDNATATMEVTTPVAEQPQPSQQSDLELYPSQLILQVDNSVPASHNQLFNNVQYFPGEPVQLVRTVTVPQSMVITSYETVIGI